MDLYISQNINADLYGMINTGGPLFCVELFKGIFHVHHNKNWWILY